MENKNVETISPIETALAKENITNQVIAELKQKYSGLTIKGLDDKAGFKEVEEARKHCKAIRVLASKICKAGREEAIQIQKDWIAKEKEVVSAIEETELHLESESNRIKEEEKRILFEAAQKAKLPIRKERLMTIGVEVEDEKLLSINDEDFNALFNDLHTKILEEKAAALKAEEKRIADEKELERKRIEAEEREKQRIENERLKAENEAKEKALAEERARAKAIQDEQDAILAAAKKKADEEAAKAKAIADLKIQQEREAKEKAEAELKAAKEAEEKRLREIEEAKEAELHKGDAAKIVDLINDLQALKTKYTFKSKKNQTLYANVVELITKTITYITK